MENLGIGIQLMIVGMLTVFCILLIVINLGKLLIKVVNAVAPEEQVAPKKAAAASAPAAAIDATTMAILEQTVSQLTGGKGHVASAKKI
ncbi:MAG: OadG family protein [Bacteroidaceae bacterium]|nr:OadG family protein [Bacteroidaceae bacterium]